MKSRVKNRYLEGTRGLSIVLTLLWGLSPAPAAAQTAGDILGSLPEETSVLVRVTSVKALSEKFSKSPLKKALDDPAVKKVLAGLQAQIDAGMAEATQTMGFSPLDLFMSFEGEVVLALGGLDPLARKLGGALSMGQPPDIGPDMVPFVAAADAGSLRDKVHGYLEKFFSLAEKEGARRSTESVEGATITVLSESDGGAGAGGAGAGGGGGNLQLFFAEKGSTFYFATNKAYLTQVLGTGGGSLATRKLFQESKAMTGMGDVFLYADIKQLTNSINSALSATFFAFYWQKIEGLLFGKSLNNLAVAFSLEDKGLRATEFIHNSGASDGILGILQGPAAPAGVPSFVPGSAQVYGNMSFNPSQFGKVVREGFQVAMSFQQPGADIDTMAQQMLGVTFSDIVKGLGKQFHSITNTADISSPIGGASYLLDLADPGPARKIVERFTSNPSMGLAPEKYKGKDLISIPVGGQVSPVVCITDDKLIVGMSKADVKTILDRMAGEGAALGDNAEVQKLLSAVAPAKVNFLSYSSAGYVEEVARSLEQGMGTFVPPEAQQMFDLMAALGRALGAGCGYGLWTSNGLQSDNLVLFR